MFSCLPSDAEQTSVTSRHRRCWASADSVSRLPVVAGYMCEVLQYGGGALAFKAGNASTLPVQLRHCDSLGQFKRLLKTYLFGGWDRGAL